MRCSRAVAQPVEQQLDNTTSKLQRNSTTIAARQKGSRATTLPQRCSRVVTQPAEKKLISSTTAQHRDCRETAQQRHDSRAAAIQHNYNRGSSSRAAAGQKRSRFKAAYEQKQYQQQKQQ